MNAFSVRLTCARVPEDSQKTPMQVMVNKETDKTQVWHQVRCDVAVLKVPCLCSGTVQEQDGRTPACKCQHTNAELRHLK